MAKNNELLKGASAINKAIDSIKNRGAKLDAAIQLAGLSVLAHASEHGDTTCADRLVQAMPKGARKLALVEWMLAFGQMRKLEKKDETEALALKNGMLFKLDRSRTLDLDSATEKEWHAFKPEQDVQTAFDVQKALGSVLARLQTASKAGMPVQHREEALTQLKALAEALGGEL